METENLDFTESQTVELKEIVTTGLKKEIIAFANSNGGQIYIGVDDDGKVVGLSDAHSDMEKISSMISNGIVPDLIPFTFVKTLSVQGKEIICIDVMQGGRPPYHLADKGLKPSGVFVRHGAVSVPASEEQIRIMLRQSDGTVFDKCRSINQELTFSYTQNIFQQKGLSFTKENMRTVGLIEKDGYFTNTALLLSDQCAHSIKIAVFDGLDKIQFKARKEFSGSLLQQLEDACNYIMLLNNQNTTFQGLSRVDNWDYPPFAVREALLNMIVHRDYNFSAPSIVSIFKDRIEFVSLGTLVSGLTLQDIMHGVSQSRNEVLADIFYRLELIESYGTGIARIMQTYKTANIQPQFLIEPSSFITVLPNTHYSGTELNFPKEKLLVVAEPPVAAYDSEPTPQKNISLKKIQNTKDAVLQLARQNGFISRTDVQKLLGCSSFPALQILRALVQQGLLVVSGTARATKYSLP